MSNQSPTSIKVEVSRKSVPHGIGFSVSAAVSPTGPNRVHGDVEFFVDDSPIGMPRTDSTGIAAVSIPGGLLPAGEHAFTATFHGDPWNAPSKSEPVTVMLEPAPGEAWPTKKAAPQEEGVAAHAVPPHPDQPQDAGKIVPQANHSPDNVNAKHPAQEVPVAPLPLVPSPVPSAPQPSPSTSTAAPANPQAVPTDPAHSSA